MPVPRFSPSSASRALHRLSHGPWRGVLAALLAMPRLALAASLSLAVAGCAAPGEDAGEEVVRAPGDAARSWAVAVDRARASLARREWASRTGDAEARLTGFAAGDTLRLVREVVTQGEQGRQAARYYFDGAQLRYYEAEATRPQAAGAAPQRVRLVLAFDQGGRVLEGTYQVDGAVAALDSVVIQGVVSRAGEVARQWAAAPAGASGAASAPAPKR